MRKIIIYPSRGRSGSIESDARTWEEIKSQVAEVVGEELSKFAITENINYTNLEHRDAVLPEGPFTIFLRPVKTVSGANPSFLDMSFSELREHISKNPSVKDILNTEAKATGRNWTQLKTIELQTILHGIENRGGVKEAVKPPKKRIEKVADTLDVEALGIEFDELKKGF